MKNRTAVTVLAAIAQESSRAVFPLLARLGRDRMAAGELKAKQ